MKTRDSANDLTVLPPPPAPPARDANPWPMPESDARPAPARSHPRLPKRVDTASEPARTPGGKSGLPSAAVVVAIALFVLGVAVLRFIESGDAKDLPGLAFAVVMLVFFAVSRIRRASRAGRRKQQASRD